MSAKSSIGVKEAFEGIIDQLEEAEVLQKYGKDKIQSLNLSNFMDKNNQIGKSSVMGRERSSKKKKKKKCCKSS